MFLKVCCLRRPFKIFELFVMTSKNEKVYYAVGRGRQTGIFESWNECKAQTDGFQNSKYRKFYSLEDAQEFLDFWENYSTPDEKLNETGNSVESDRNEEKSMENSKISFNEEPVTTLATVKQECVPMDSSALQPPLLLNTNSSDRKSWNQNNIDILALNLRFDSFEKRFDACLKDIGAISSEISHLRSDIKELTESLNNSPKKGKDGLLQTILKFPSSPGTPSRSSRRDSSDSDEPKKKRQCVKRKLSKKDSLEDQKVSEADPMDDLIAKRAAEGVDMTSFVVDEKGFVEVYTDGSALKNGNVGAKAGIGIWFGDDHPLNVGEAVVGPPTSITAEIQAARVAMQLALRFGINKLKICTDSEFVINCATKWMHRWRTNGWKLSDGGPVKNKKELEKLDKFMSQLTVRWEKVAGHTNVKGNENADRLANEGAAKYRR